MKLESHQSTEVKDRYELVRTDSYSALPGRIISADEDTGEATLEVQVHGEKQNQTISLGAGGFKIVGRSRYATG